MGQRAGDRVVRFRNLDTIFFVMSKLLGVALKLEAWLLVMALITVWASLRQKIRGVRTVSSLIALVILGIGFLPIGDVLMHPLEADFPARKELGIVDGIVLLGGSEDVLASDHSGQPQLSEGGDRYIAALELAHRYPEARLLFAGGSGRLRNLGRAELSEASIAKRIFQAQGIAPKRILLEDQSRNTTENARQSYALAKPGAGERWVLITSAFHMPRAIGSFKAAGWPEILPYPVDFRARDWSNGFSWDFQRNLGLTNTALREWAGRLIYSATGR